MRASRSVTSKRGWCASARAAAMRSASGASPRVSLSGLPGVAHAILEGGELLDPDRAAGVEAAGGDADLGAETELAAVGELGRGVVQHDRRIDLGQEFLRRRLVLG